MNQGGGDRSAFGRRSLPGRWTREDGQARWGEVEAAPGRCAPETGQGNWTGTHWGVAPGKMDKRVGRTVEAAPGSCAPGSWTGSSPQELEAGGLDRRAPGKSGPGDWTGAHWRSWTGASPQARVRCVRASSCLGTGQARAPGRGLGGPAIGQARRARGGLRPRRQWTGASPAAFGRPHTGGLDRRAVGKLDRRESSLGFRGAAGSSPSWKLGEARVLAGFDPGDWTCAPGREQARALRYQGGGDRSVS